MNLKLTKSKNNLPSVMDYSSYRSFLQAVFDARKIQNRSYSFSVWARRLGIKSASTLVMILKGSRNPSEELIENMALEIRLNQREALYFRNLVALEKTKKDSPLFARITAALEHRHPLKQFQKLEADRFEVIAHWHFYAIRELVELPEFHEDPQWIVQRLRYKVSPKEVSRALNILEQNGLLKRDSDQRLRYTVPIATSFDSQNEALKVYHEEILNLVKDSVRTVPIDQREISGMTFSMNKKDLPKAQQILRSAFNELLQLSQQTNLGVDTVYQFEMALIPLTKEHPSC